MARTPTLIVIFQRGAMDGLNVVVPYADGSYYDLRPQISIAPPGDADGGIDLDGRFALNPALAMLKPLYDAGELAAVHAVGNMLADRSHFSAQARMEVAGSSGSGAAGGWLGRHLASTARASERRIRGISIGAALDQSLAGSVDVAAIASSADFQLRSRDAQIWTPALQLLNDGVAPSYVSQSERVFTVLDLFQQKRPDEIAVADNAHYPATSYGNALKQAAQYIKADIGVEVITLSIAGWDHHARENVFLPTVLDEFGSGLLALRTDLGALFQDVTVVSMSEFGRRAQENAAAGTDHGRGNAMFVMGGGIRGGRVITDWPGLSPSALDEGDLRISIDYRDVLAEILTHGSAGAQLAGVFPGFTPARSVGLY